MLVIRNALLISSMDHNLLPPFLVREASLFLDETPKFQSTDLTQDNHSIFGEETGMMIHLQLNGAFSYFPTQLLILDQQLNWDNYPVVGGPVERSFFGTFFCGEVKKKLCREGKKSSGSRTDGNTNFVNHLRSTTLPSPQPFQQFHSLAVRIGNFWQRYGI